MVQNRQDQEECFAKSVYCRSLFHDLHSHRMNLQVFICQSITNSLQTLSVQIHICHDSPSSDRTERALYREWSSLLPVWKSETFAVNPHISIRRDHTNLSTRRHLSRRGRHYIY